MKEEKNILSHKKNSILDKSNDQNIVINCRCFCEKSFFVVEKILYVLPCCHIIHEKCFNNYILNQQYKKLFNTQNININKKITDTNNFLKCPLCQTNIITVLTENKINLKKKYLQYKIDIKSIRLDNSATINYMILPLSIIKFTSFINKLLIANTERDLVNTIEYIFSSFNFKINIIDNTNKNPIIVKDNKITWKNKKDNDNNSLFLFLFNK